VLIRSLALHTDLALAATRGRVIDRGDYMVVETPDDPNYYDGNVLVLPAAPQVGEVGFWTRRFNDELGKNPAIKHVSLWWDGTTGDVGAREELEAAGFTIMTSQVMVADEIDAPRGFAALPIRTMTAEEVLATADVAYALGDRHDEIYRLFLDRPPAWHRDLVAKNVSTFWVAFAGVELVASLGLAWVDQQFARYQDVQTLPTHRKRGIATALLAMSARAGFERGAEHVVIVAEPDSEGARIYERLGFRTLERTANARRVTR